MPAPDPQNPAPEPPAELFAGKYRLLRLLGKGAMGEVWLAEEEGPRNFRRRVAVKRLLNRPDIGEYAPESFFAEAQVVARLDHPNIVRLIELGIADGAVFLVLDYVDGPALDRLVKKGGGAFSPRAVAYIGREVARALEAVHQMCDDEGRSYGVVHRDISPSNILVARDGRVRLTDFGVARISGLGGEKTETGVFKGKLPYMPPEQARGDAFDGRADVFSLGVTLIETLVGRRLRKAETQTQLIMKIASMPVPRVRELLPGAPPALADALDAAVAFEADDRTQSAGELAEALEKALWSMGPTAEQDARRELKQRVEALTGQPEPTTGSHVRQATPSRTGGTPSRAAAVPRPASKPPLLGREPAPASVPTVALPGARGGHEGARSYAPPPVLIVDAPAQDAPAASLSGPVSPLSPGSVTAPSGADDATSSSVGLVEPPHRDRRLLWLAGLGLLVGAASAFALLREGQPEGADAPAAQDTAAAGPSTEPEVQPAGTAISTAATAADTGAPAAAAGAGAAPPSSAPSSAAGPAAPAAPGRTTKPRAPVGPAAAKADPPEADASAPGTLQVVVLPWAEVSVDGRGVGTTPMPAISLPPGSHTVVLRNAELGAKRSLGVVIKPGKPTLLRVDLRRTE